MKKPVYGYEGRYEINKSGEIWSLERKQIINGKLNTWPGKKLKPFLDANGYLYVNLCDGKKAKKIAVHRAVLLSFIGDVETHMIACHFDGNKTNNNLNNLRWGTFKENYADSVKHGTNSKGMKSGNAKLNDDQVKEILENKQSSLAICKKYNVASSTIRAIRIKQNWKHINV